jgi:16S rRNA (cytosine967-C5)-methyltransferase
MKFSRRVALDILINVETKRRHPDDLLSDAFKKHRTLTDLDRAFITELVYGTLRWQGKLDWVIQRFSTVKLERMERAILHTLRMGVYQLLFLTKTPHRAAVNEAVNLAKKLGRQEAAGFVNALLRRVIREGGTESLSAVQGDPQEILAVEEAFPLWAVKKLWALWGENETRAFCQASNQHARLTLRVNVLKTDRMSLMERMRKEGLSVSATAFSSDGVTIQNAPPVSKIPFLGSGIYQIQDEAAQLIAYLVNPKPGEKILDVCAAPGSKTTHLAQLMGNRGTIHALDINGQRLRLLRESCRRMGIRNVTVLKRDVTRALSCFEGQKFDAILVDAPCTGWGTIRRNPDIKWQTGFQDISRLALLQQKILDSVAGLLKETGRLIYSTCTVYEEENEDVVSGFLRAKKDFCLDRRTCRFLDETLFDHRGFFRTLPHRHKTDGFFGARLVRV